MLGRGSSTAPGFVILALLLTCGALAAVGGFIVHPIACSGAPPLLPRAAGCVFATPAAAVKHPLSR
eukprot:2002064-Amphidinium_carterae.1